MPRKRLQKDAFLPYHVTARANNRDVFPGPLDRVWKIICENCLFLTFIFDVEFQALVLMPNHFHILLTVPGQDLGVVMNDFMRSVSRSLNRASGRSGHVFGGSYHWSLIANARYYGHALKYVYRNPIRGHLCTRAESYAYSTLHGLVGAGHLPFPIHLTRPCFESILPACEAHQQLEWLNAGFGNGTEARIRAGLRHRLFDTITDRRTRRPQEEFQQLL
jgi:putative transposase